MGLTKEQLTQRSVNKMVDFIKKNGTKVHTAYIWDNNPIVIQDICCDAVLYDGETVWFGDYNEQKEFIKRKNITDVIHRSFIDDCLADMK